MHYQAVFFDFDGVILDSIHVKTEAFAAMFRQYGPEIERAVVEYHLAHGGVSRFRKFEYYYAHLLNKPIDEQTLKRLGNEFNSLALQGVLYAPFIPGALETLRELKHRKVPCFVASGTPDEEIKLIVEKRDIGSFFLEIHGSPRKKEEIVQDVLERYGYDPGKCLFIGDAMTDYEAAQKCGAEFLGIVQDGHESPFPGGTVVRAQVVLE